LRPVLDARYRAGRANATLDAIADVHTRFTAGACFSHVERAVRPEGQMAGLVQAGCNGNIVSRLRRSRFGAGQARRRDQRQQQPEYEEIPHMF
jgi:hypothetical protein